MKTFKYTSSMLALVAWLPSYRCNIVKAYYPLCSVVFNVNQNSNCACHTFLRQVLALVVQVITVFIYLLI